MDDGYCNFRADCRLTQPKVAARLDHVIKMLLGFFGKNKARQGRQRQTLIGLLTLPHGF